MLIKLLKRIFRIGHIKTVSDHMKPLIKTREKLKDSRTARIVRQDKNRQRMDKLVADNEFHQAEVELADEMIEALNSQLKPLDKLSKK